MGVEAAAGAGAVQATILRAIDGLRPDPSVPDDAAARRYYDLLRTRYVNGLTQEAAARVLDISPRYLRELQARAIAALARRLWASAATGAPRESTPSPEDVVSEEAVPAGQARNWSSQVQRELAALQRTAPHLAANLATTACSAARLGSTVGLVREGQVIVEAMDPALHVSIHPTALRQVLLKAIEELARHVTSEPITISGQRAGAVVQIRVGGRTSEAEVPLGVRLIEEILAAHHGAVHVSSELGLQTIAIEIPAVLPDQEISVLVIDDNEDLVSFFASYTAGTAYRIRHAGTGAQALDALRERRPDVIVLDVMLPDAAIDGWELLMQLHEHPRTQSVPVIVCSVIRDEELALSLGAVGYLPKPVRRQEFLRALDHAVSRIPPTAPPTGDTP